jgi:hypothetical protein
MKPPISDVGCEHRSYMSLFVHSSTVLYSSVTSRRWISFELSFWQSQRFSVETYARNNH